VAEGASRGGRRASRRCVRPASDVDEAIGTGDAMVSFKFVLRCGWCTMKILEG
jgi:hypothetical protein